MTNWVKVEFYAQPPAGVDIKGIDLFEISENLAKVFGFETIDGLVVMRVSKEVPNDLRLKRS